MGRGRIYLIATNDLLEKTPMLLNLLDTKYFKYKLLFFFQ